VGGSDWLRTVGSSFGITGAGFVGSFSLGTAPTTLADTDIQAAIQQGITAGTWPGPGAAGDVSYLILTPPGTTVVQQSGEQSCSAFDGYHDSFQTTTSDWATYMVLAQCQGGGWAFDAASNLELAASHELLEMMTDPLLNNATSGWNFYSWTSGPNTSPWAYAGGGEVGDTCDGLWYQDPDAGFYAQLIWSNDYLQGGKPYPCAPWDPAQPWFGVLSDQVVYALPGASVTVPLTGWSSGSTSPWYIDAYSENTGSFTPDFSLDAGAMAVGQTAYLTLTVPSSVGVPGDGSLQVGPVVVNSIDHGGYVLSQWPVLVEVPPVGLACTPPSSGADPCAAYGLACLTDGSGNTTCQLPQEFYSCLPGVGCASPLTCQANGTQPDGGPALECIEPCSHSSDCFDPFATCQNGSCFYVLCGPGSSNGTDYYAPCNMDGTNDGTCLPIAPGEPGYCMAGGSTAVGSDCTYDRGSTPLCAVGSYCIYGNSTNGGVCMPLCEGGVTATDGGPGCSAQDLCVGLSNSEFGVCAQNCTGAPSSCPASSSCDALNSTQDVCWPGGISCDGSNASTVCPNLSCTCANGTTETAHDCWNGQCVTSCPPNNLGAGQSCIDSCFCASTTCSFTQHTCCASAGTRATNSACSVDCDCQSGWCLNGSCT
jgi:hypothetical protein